MEIKGNIKLFINLIKNKESGEVNRVYSTSVGKKDKEGKYINTSLSVFLAKEFFPAEKLEKLDTNAYYDLEVENGFLSVETYKDGTTHPALVVLAGRLTAKHPIALKKEPVKTVATDALPF